MLNMNRVECILYKNNLIKINIDNITVYYNTT